MRMSNLAFWTHALSKQEVKEMYLKSKLIHDSLTALRARWSKVVSNDYSINQLINQSINQSIN